MTNQSWHKTTNRSGTVLEPRGAVHISLLTLTCVVVFQCYFFTVEFGLCKQEGKLRAYGAGLLSSISELKHALSGNAVIMPFDPKVTCKQECIITTFQDVYFVSDSFEEAKVKMR
nr:tryptophan 5-hydroxylase 1-like [Oncorhynchus nerka]